MKNQNKFRSTNYHQSLQQLSDTYVDEGQNNQQGISNLSISSSPITKNETDNLDCQKNFFVWDDKTNLIIYFYALNNIYYECSLNSHRAQKEVSTFLKNNNVCLEQDCNILEYITDLAAFHKNFLKHFSHSDSVFYVDHNDDSSSTNSEDDDSSDLSDSDPYQDMELTLVDTSTLAQTKEE